MAHIGNIAICAAAMTAVWTLIGLPIALRLIGSPNPWLFAPALGWAVHSAILLPISELIGSNRLNVLAAAMLCTVVAVVALSRSERAARLPAILVVAVLAAAVLALGPMEGIIPKPTSEGLTLASPIFDHSKIAMIDEMIRSGVPAGNPFFGEIGAPDHVAYYYLWHFSAAAAAIATGVSGWEADAALTWFTAFASLLTMIGLATTIGGRASAGVIVVLLAATTSLRTTLEWLWPDSVHGVIGSASGFGGWLFQTSWAPQHVASAMCVVIACALISRLGERREWFAPVVLGLVGAAAFESSIWVGGVVFALAATTIGLFRLHTLASERRMHFVIGAGISAVIAGALAIPFVYDQLAAAMLRGPETLIAFTPVDVLGSAFSAESRRVLDPPAFWLVYLPIEFPAFLPAGFIGLYLLLRGRMPAADGRRLVPALALLMATSLFAAWLLVSVIGDNNDLGWRAVLPAVLILISVAASAISQWPAYWARAAAALAIVGAVLSLPETAKYIGENIAGLRKPSERIFAATPSMWEAVRRHTNPKERVANNPHFLGDMTPWPVNISWALLADRRSCYAGRELAIPFAPIPAPRRAEIEAQFVRVFAGDPQPGDIQELARHFRCDTIVVTVQDGAWQRDPFAASEFYRLADSKPDGWRIYRRTERKP